MKAIQVREHGGPEVLELREVPDPEPEAGRMIVRMEAIGLNYVDTYHRTGLYPVDLPMIPGLEGAGTVTAVGEGETEFRVGDRVVFTSNPGAYAELVSVSAERAVRLPEEIDFRRGAAALLQGMTAQYLAVSTYPLRKRDTCLIHAAAGGVGLLLVQIAKMRGATVIGTVSTEQKERLALEAGADHVIRYTEEDFGQAVRRLTGGEGVHVVYDSVGKTTFEKSLGCLRRIGMLVSFGQSSGPIGAVDPLELGRRGSLFLTRPSLFDYAAERESFVRRAGDVLGWIASGRLTLRIGQTFPLAEAARAHRALEGRETTGKTLLIP